MEILMRHTLIIQKKMKKKKKTKVTQNRKRLNYQIYRAQE